MFDTVVENNEDVMEDDGPDVKLLCHAVSCSRCYNPNVAHLSTQLMWYQAEVVIHLRCNLGGSELYIMPAHKFVII